MKQFFLFLAICACAICSIGALTFGGLNSDRVDFGSGTSIDDVNPFTAMGWFYATTQTGNRYFWSKFSGGQGSELLWAGADANDIALFVQRTTVDATARSSINFSTNTWYFVACTYDDTDGPRIYFGTESTPVAEVSSYAVRTVGIDAKLSDAAGSLIVGNASALTNAFQGRIAGFIYVSGLLTAAQIESYRIRYKITTDNKMMSYLGLFGTGNQLDISGNGNNGTITGAMQSDGPAQIILLWGQGRRILK